MDGFETSELVTKQIDISRYETFDSTKFEWLNVNTEVRDHYGVTAIGDAI